MWSKMKRSKTLWAVFRLLSWEYQPPYGSVGHSVQSGKITREEAREYLGM